MLLSAPTSFGKTFIALEYMARATFSNIVFVVPTLALMNELSSKIRKSLEKNITLLQILLKILVKKYIYFSSRKN